MTKIEKRERSRGGGGHEIDVHVSTVITTAEVILQLRAELRRESLVLLERRIIAVSGHSVPSPPAAAGLLDTRFPERCECQMFRCL
jgi:hypothetical protein